MPDIGSILERESSTVQAPEGFERLVRRRDRRRRNRQVGAIVVAIALSSLAVVALVRAFGFEGRATPAETPPRTALAVCPPGSTPNEPGAVEQARPSSGSYMPMAVDRGSGRIVLIRARRDGPPTTWTFDVCTNAWQQMSPEQEPIGGRAWGPMAYDADSDLTVAVLEGGSVWAYDVESDSWTQKGPAPFDNDAYATTRMTYDPSSGLLWALRDLDGDGGTMWTYDVDSDTWLEAQQENSPTGLGPGDHQLFAYDASIERLVAFAASPQAGPAPGMAGATWTFDPRTGRWAEGGATAPSFNTGYFASGGEIAYDETAQRTVVFSDGLTAAYDAVGDRWVRIDGRSGCCDEGPLNRLGHRMVYDPVNQRLVVYGGTARLAGGWRPMDDVWAFETETGEWIRLLPPSEADGA